MSPANAVKPSRGREAAILHQLARSPLGEGPGAMTLAEIKRERGEYRLGSGKPRVTWNQHVSHVAAYTAACMI